MPPIKCTFCNRGAEVNHHVSYVKNITIPLCRSCHASFHANYFMSTPNRKHLDKLPLEKWKDKQPDVFL